MLSVFRSPTFVLCFFANLAQMTSFSLFLHFPGHITALGADTQTVGWLVAATQLAALSISPFVGRWLDTRGRRQVLMTGSLLNILVGASFLIAPSLAPAFALRIMHGVVETMLNVAFFTYASDVIPTRNRAQGFGLFGISAMASVGLGALIGDGAIALVGLQGIFIASIALAGLGLLIVRALPELGANSGAIGDGVPGGSQSANQSANQEENRAIERTPARRGWMLTLGHPPLLGVWVLTVVLFFSMTSVFVYLKLWVGLSDIGSLGLFFGIYATTAITLRLFVGGLPDRSGPWPVALAALVAYATGLLLLAHASTLALFVAAAFACGVGHGFGYPVLLALVTTRAGDADRGSAIAIFNALDDSAALIAGPALGFLINAGGYELMYTASSAVILLGIVTAIALNTARGVR